MATRRRQGSGSQSPPRLMVPAKQLHGEVDDRLVAGQELIDKPGESEEDLKEGRRDYYTWTEYNEALLRRSFDTAEPADEYARRGAAFSRLAGRPTRSR